jgi:methionyl-tRNA formyltransferase
LSSVPSRDRFIALVGSEPGKEILRWLVDAFPGDVAIAVVRDEGILSELLDSNKVDSVLRVTRPHSWLDFVSRRLPAGEPMAGLLLWWPEILTEAELSIAQCGFVNIHPSLLPFGRGSNPNFWAIIEGTPFGASIHEVTLSLDGGPIVDQVEIPVSWTDTGESLYRAATKECVELFKRWYRRTRNQTSPSQKNTHVSPRRPRRRAEMDQVSQLDLDAQMSVRALINILRARTFSGYPSAWFRDGDCEFEIRVQIVPKER